MIGSHFEFDVKETILTAIKLLEKLGADLLFDPIILNKDEKVSLEYIMHNAEIFNAVEVITLPDEDETKEEESEDGPQEEIGQLYNIFVQGLIKLIF
jgi:hypothetical protein